MPKNWHTRTTRRHVPDEEGDRVKTKKTDQQQPRMCWHCDRQIQDYDSLITHDGKIYAVHISCEAAARAALAAKV